VLDSFQFGGAWSYAAEEPTKWWRGGDQLSISARLVRRVGCQRHFKAEEGPMAKYLILIYGR
jgi:hypothetical protein